MLLLDTCTLLWLAADQAKLSRQATTLIVEHGDALFVSAISAFEIGVKHRRGGLVLPMPVSSWIHAVLDFHAVVEIPVDCRIAAASTELPPLHNDPCDRMIVATARVHNLTIVTPDPLITQYPDARVAW